MSTPAPAPRLRGYCKRCLSSMFKLVPGGCEFCVNQTPTLYAVAEYSRVACVRLSPARGGR